jgi:hypothetical protein
MNDPKQQIDRKEMMLKNVRKNARNQSTAECRENYFKSCESHGVELTEIVSVVRKEFVG